MIRGLERDCTGSCASVLVDGGDLFQGTPASNLAFGRPVIALYNALGYAATAVGNHDFDWSQDTLRARMREARFAMLAANVTDAAGKPVPWIRPDTMVERGGLADDRSPEPSSDRVRALFRDVPNRLLHR